jgi:hypothetical protein
MSSQTEQVTAKNPIVMQSDPDRTLIIVSDDDRIYRLDKSVWQREEYLLQKDPGSVGIVNQLTAFGSYLAFVDKNLAIGIGACCAVVNLRSVLKGAGVEKQPTAPYPQG